jgi:hypothetical protein
MARDTSRSVICWLPTLARVELLMPKLPELKLAMSPIANDARIATTKSTMMIDPTVDFDRRRKKANIDLSAFGKVIGAALGVSALRIKAAALSYPGQDG